MGCEQAGLSVLVSVTSKLSFVRGFRLRIFYKCLCFCKKQLFLESLEQNVFFVWFRKLIFSQDAFLKQWAMDGKNAKRKSGV